MTHFLHCFKQFKKLLKTVFLEEARYFAGLFFSVRSYRQVWPEGMSSDTKDKTYGESIGQTTACRAPCKDPKTGKISTCKSAKHSTKDHPKENFEANLAIIELFGRDIDSPFDYEDAEDWTVQQVDVPVPVSLAPAIPAEAKTWMA